METSQCCCVCTSGALNGSDNQIGKSIVSHCYLLVDYFCQRCLKLCTANAKQCCEFKEGEYIMSISYFIFLNCEVALAQSQSIKCKDFYKLSESRLKVGSDLFSYIVYRRLLYIEVHPPTDSKFCVVWILPTVAMYVPWKSV